MNNGLIETEIQAQSLKRYLQFKSYAFMYEKLFETRFAHTDEERAQAFQVRYEVYCAEYGFEEAQKFSDKMFAGSTIVNAWYFLERYHADLQYMLHHADLQNH